MTNKDVAQKVVDRIVEMVNNGQPLPWVKPWTTEPNTVRVYDGYKEVTVQPRGWSRTGKEYKGANTYLPHGEYITYNQCQKEGGTVKKGAKAWPIVYWKFLEKETVVETTNENGETEFEIVKKKIPMLKYYLVFSVNDCNGIKQKHNPKPHVYTVPITHTETVEAAHNLDGTAEAIVADYIGRAGNGFHVDRDKVSDRAFYNPMLDYVNVPKREQFKSLSEFYSTLFHELAHSTGHETRLNRMAGENKIAAWGDEAYSREELVAESTAAAILNSIGMEEANTFRNSAAYIKGWASNISRDPMMYITAATRAQDAFDMILGIDTKDSDNEDGAAD